MIIPQGTEYLHCTHDNPNSTHDIPHDTEDSNSTQDIPPPPPPHIYHEIPPRYTDIPPHAS